ncbi:MAG: helix-turn-helix transcriptional regulator [Deltaproteobacteria bacterium]|nr:helix-turn-helix transcriptional regulator [Deltaproteobacteria bacterium]
MEADEITALRKRLGLTMGQLGEKLGVPQATVIQWEHAERFPTKAHVAKLKALASDEGGSAAKRAQADAAASIYAPFLAEDDLWVLLRKLLFHPELRKRALDLAASFPDPAGR